jgi:hypothetical protein
MERVRFADGVSQQTAGWAVASGHVHERWVAELRFSTGAQRPPDLWLVANGVKFKKAIKHA